MNIRAAIIQTLIGAYSLVPTMVHAYVGPGLGAGTVAVVLGVLFGLVMLVVGVVWYPIKRLWGRIRNRK